jgi:hypothetical protein
MTVWYDSERDAVVANLAEQYVHLEDDGALVIDVSYIFNQGRGVGKCKEWVSAWIDAATSRVSG